VTIRGHQRALRGHSEGNHIQREALAGGHVRDVNPAGGNQRQSEAIRGNQRQSEAIRGNQRHVRDVNPAVAALFALLPSS